jgi:hypothetical protein
MSGSKWNAVELNEKTVSCTFRDKSGVWETIGKLVAEQKEDDLSVEIWIQEVTPDNQIMLNRVALPSKYVEKLQKNENGESDFVLAGEMDLAPGNE